MEHDKTQNIHCQFSTECFNKCWTFIDKPQRSPQDVEDMLLLAHASLWHWKQRSDCEPVNLSIGYWQLSRVYALADQYEAARLFGEKCLKTGQENQLGAFHVGYGYEALARAEVVHKDKVKAKDLLAKARSELNKVTDEDEKSLLEADIASIENALSTQ